jgi:hypothetical protein
MLSPRALRRRPAFTSVALVAAVSLLWASVASAAPATVTAEDADVHTTPLRSAPVLHTFHAGEKISAEEESHDGWRRVHTPDGQVGFLPDDQLRLDGPPPPFPTAPAKVKAFELPARSAPEPNAPVLQTFAEGDALAVSADERAGFRRVMLPDGRIAFVASTGLTLGSPLAARATPVAAAPVEPLVAPPREPRPTIYVKDLKHLEKLVKRDDVVAPMVDKLETKRNVALGVGLGGTAVGLALMLGSFTVFATKNCTDYGLGTSPICSNDPSLGALVAGGAVLFFSEVAWWALYPKRADLIDIINTWNTRHVDNQFTFESQSMGRDPASRAFSPY